VYLRQTKRENKDGTVAHYLQLAHNVRDPETGVVKAKKNICRSIGLSTCPNPPAITTFGSRTAGSRRIGSPTVWQHASPCLTHAETSTGTAAAPSNTQNPLPPRRHLRNPGSTRVVYEECRPRARWAGFG